ncbi:recombination mediator RecR [Mucisphaera calidilacus]|uniref:Recombination protein RecR n=1 Tax=Mucisphaera calidilacus TaxID=2527982 RepID=A0A518BV34_9BACT|nr:recombination mediator RecR [Mucisphaera calidilacus]QDU70826.1 Recombination protein RecR [Mucisphaera calidilacus]
MPNPENDSAWTRLIDRLGRLPGIGKRSAERIAFHLIRQPPEETQTLATALNDLVTDLRVCSECGNLSEADPCAICADTKRDRTTVMVVERPSDIVAIEQLGSYRGLYHVLLGRLAPLDGIGPGEMNTEPLLERIRSSSIDEVVLATTPTLEGDGTALFLMEQLERLGVRVTRLARGMPTGSNFASVSKAVLSDAIQGRTSMNAGQ